MSFLALAWQFIVLASKGLWSWYSVKDLSDKTNIQAQDILKKQRDGQITDDTKADKFWSDHPNL